MKNIIQPVFSRTVATATLGAVALSALAGVAQACSCAPPPAPKIALEQSAAVFVGKATKMEAAGFNNRFQFSVSKKWKGIEGNTALVVSASDSAACGINFEPNRDYLVYAYKMKGDDQLRTNLCTRTARLSDAAADVAALGAPMGNAQNAAAKPATIAPSVIERDGLVQIRVGMLTNDAAQPLALLSRTLQNHSTAQKIRLNWKFNWNLNTFPPTIRRGYATALYNRDDSTLKLYSKYNDAAGSYVKHVLYAGVTDEKLGQLADKYRSGGDAMENFAFLDNLPQVGATATDLGSKTQKRMIFNLK